MCEEDTTVSTEKDGLLDFKRRRIVEMQDFLNWQFVPIFI